MGLFSWTTSDTNESIMNKWSSQHRVVYLLTPNKNIKIVSYGGYGDFTTDKGEVIKVTDHKWIVDGKGREQPSYKGLTLKFSFNPIAKYNDLPASDNCPLQGHDWGNSDSTIYKAIDNFSIKGRAGTNTGQSTRDAIESALVRGFTLKDISAVTDRSVSTLRQIKCGSIKNPPANLAVIINEL